MHSFSVIFYLTSLCLSCLNCNCVSSPHFDIQMCLTSKGWTWHLCLAFRANKFSLLLPLTLSQPSLSLLALSATSYPPFRPRVSRCDPSLATCSNFIRHSRLNNSHPLFFLSPPDTFSQSSLQLQFIFQLASSSLHFYVQYFIHYTNHFCLCSHRCPLSLSIYIALHGWVLCFNLICLLSCPYCLSNHWVFQINHVSLVWKEGPCCQSTLITLTDMK